MALSLIYTSVISVAQNRMTIETTLFLIVLVHINATLHSLILEEGPVLCWCDSSMILATKGLQTKTKTQPSCTI